MLDEKPHKGVHPWREFRKRFKTFCYELSDLKLKQLSKIVNAVRREKYRKNQKYLSEGVDRIFTEDELCAFFNALPNQKYRLAFMLQLALALRISELAPINVRDIDFHRQTIIIHEQKTGKHIEKKVPAELFERLIAYIGHRKAEIKAHGGFLWYSDGSPSKKLQKPHNSKDWLRNLFNKTRDKAGLTRTYADSKDGKRLYAISTHSLRRTGITRMARALNGDVFKLKLYSGHKKTDSLEKYVQYNSKEEIAKLIDEVFR